MGADPRSTANFAGKEKEKKEKEITSSVTGTGEKKPQIGESSKESGKGEKENSHYQRVQRVRNKVSDFVRNSYGDSCDESLSRTNESQFKKQRVQSSNCLDLSCIQTDYLKAESKTFCYIDTDEIPGFFPVTKIWYPVKIQFLSFTCEDITVVMVTSVSAHRKRASQHLAIVVYIINSLLHARLWICILSSTREISS